MLDEWEWTKMYLTHFQPCHTPSSWMLLVSSPRKLKVILQDSISKSPEKGWWCYGMLRWNPPKHMKSTDIQYILLPTSNNTKAPPQPIRPFVSLGYQCLASPLLPFQSPASSIEFQHCHGRWICEKIATSQCFIPQNISKCFIALYIYVCIYNSLYIYIPNFLHKKPPFAKEDSATVNLEILWYSSLAFLYKRCTSSYSFPPTKLLPPGRWCEAQWPPPDVSGDFSPDEDPESTLQQSVKVHPRKLTWIHKMMVWKRWSPLNMAVFGIYVRFLGGKPTVDAKNFVNHIDSWIKYSSWSYAPKK